jgi:hypothetical protein
MKSVTRMTHESLTDTYWEESDRCDISKCGRIVIQYLQLLSEQHLYLSD